MAEILDLYNEQNNPLGITKPRADVHRDGDWHRTVHIYVLNYHGQFLAHLCSPFKDAKPNCWDTRFGSHVTEGMDYEQTATQELEQEIGISITADKLIVRQKQNFDDGTNREHIQVYSYCFNGAINNLHFNDNEIVEVKWMSSIEIIKEIKEKPERWACGIQNFETINKFIKKII